MKTDIMIDQETQKVKVILDWKTEIVGQKLTADEAEDVAKLIEQASREAVARRSGSGLCSSSIHYEESICHRRQNVSVQTFQWSMMSIHWSFTSHTCPLLLEELLEFRVVFGRCTMPAFHFASLLKGLKRCKTTQSNKTTQYQFLFFCQI